MRKVNRVGGSLKEHVNVGKVLGALEICMLLLAESSIQSKVAFAGE